jgi:hypothetical protein
MEAFGIKPAYSEGSDKGIDNVTVLQSMVFDTFLIKSETLPKEQANKPIEKNPSQEGQANTEKTQGKVDFIYILLVVIGFMLLGAFMLHAKDKRKDLL